MGSKTAVTRQRADTESLGFCAKIPADGENHNRAREHQASAWCLPPRSVKCRIYQFYTSHQQRYSSTHNESSRCSC